MRFDIDSRRDVEVSVSGPNPFVSAAVSPDGAQLAFFVEDYGVPSGSQAAIISCRQQDVAPGKGTIVVAAAGT